MIASVCTEYCASSYPTVLTCRHNADSHASAHSTENERESVMNASTRRSICSVTGSRIFVQLSTHACLADAAHAQLLDATHGNTRVTTQSGSQMHHVNCALTRRMMSELYRF